MKTHLATAALALVMAAPAAPAHDMPLPGPRPFEEMRGGCADFAMDVTREAAAWAAGPRAEVAAAAAPGAAPVVAAATLTQVALRPHPEVAFAPPPEQDRGAPDRFAGHVRVAVPKAGLWRVAASNGLWFDAVADGRILPSAAFEMQTRCAGPFKVVVFDLPAGEVALQFNGSPTAAVAVLLLPWTEH